MSFLEFKRVHDTPGVFVFAAFVHTLLEMPTAMKRQFNPALSVSWHEKSTMRKNVCSRIYPHP